MKSMVVADKREALVYLLLSFVVHQNLMASEVE